MARKTKKSRINKKSRIKKKCALVRFFLQGIVADRITDS